MLGRWRTRTCTIQLMVDMYRRPRGEQLGPDVRVPGLGRRELRGETLEQLSPRLLGVNLVERVPDGVLLLQVTDPVAEALLSALSHRR